MKYENQFLFNRLTSSFPDVIGVTNPTLKAILFRLKV